MKKTPTPAAARAAPQISCKMFGCRAIALFRRLLGALVFAGDGFYSRAPSRHVLVNLNH
jgi:hypothetical protein